jgi:hypothetical protein
MSFDLQTGDWCTVRSIPVLTNKHYYPCNYGAKETTLWLNVKVTANVNTSRIKRVEIDIMNTERSPVSSKIPSKTKQAHSTQLITPHFKSN